MRSLERLAEVISTGLLDTPRRSRHAERVGSLTISKDVIYTGLCKTAKNKKLPVEELQDRLVGQALHGVAHRQAEGVGERQACLRVGLQARRVVDVGRGSHGGFGGARRLLGGWAETAAHPGRTDTERQTHARFRKYHVVSGRERRSM